MKEYKWSYLAALIDGEGSICVTHCLRWHWTNAAKTNKKQYPTFQLFVAVTNKSEDLMKWLVTNFGGRYYPKKRSRPDKWAQAWDWQVKGLANKKKILLGILPYLVVKRKQATLALQWFDLPEWGAVEQRDIIRKKMCAFNRRGPSTTNTLNGSDIQDQSNLLDEPKIESELHGDMQSEPAVTQNS